MSIPTGLKKAAVICILQHQQQYLLLQRAKAPNQGLYTPVGGKLAPYEDPYEAALRETQEETGYELPSLHFCGLLTETSPTPYNWMSYVYRAEVDFRPPPPCAEGVLRWVEAAELPQLPMPQTDALIYQYVGRQQPFCFRALYDDRLHLTSMWEDLQTRQVYQGS